MTLLAIATKIAGLILQYPIERHFRNNHNCSDNTYEELKTSLLSSVKVETPLRKPSPELPLDEIIKREREGDYCFSCVPAKHLMRAKDALTDALNIANSEGKFTDVAETKIQEAVYELNGAEKDLEKARVPEVLKPATSEMHKQIRKLRNFLRQDQSGLEIATAMSPDMFEDMKKALEMASAVNDALIQHGYEISKVQSKVREEAQNGEN